jgi:predicted ArsR family transcriptional regulator
VISELLKLLESGTPMTLQQIADKLHTTCDIVQSMLEMLAKKGVVEKIETCSVSSACGKCKMKCGCETANNKTLNIVSFKLKQ